MCRPRGAPTNDSNVRRSGERHEVEQGFIEERPVTFRHQDDAVRFEIRDEIGVMAHEDECALDQAEVEKERAVLREAAIKEGKPENIVDKMVEGRMRNYYAERVLLEQPFVKEQKMTVGQFAKENGMKISRFVHWELGRE